MKNFGFFLWSNQEELSLNNFLQVNEIFENEFLGFLTISLHQYHKEKVVPADLWQNERE